MREIVFLFYRGSKMLFRHVKKIWWSVVSEFYRDLRWRVSSTICSALCVVRRRKNEKLLRRRHDTHVCRGKTKCARTRQHRAETKIFRPTRSSPAVDIIAKIRFFRCTVESVICVFLNIVHIIIKKKKMINRNYLLLEKSVYVNVFFIFYFRKMTNE